MKVASALAVVADADRIGRFQTVCWDQAYRGIVPQDYLDATTWQMRAERWAGRIRTGERRVWLAEDDSGLVGVASTAQTASQRPDLPPIELCTIYVDRRAHGSGIAAELLGTALDGAAAHLLVFAANGRAQAFYAKHGFRPTGELAVDADTGMEEQRWVRAARVTS